MIHKLYSDVSAPEPLNCGHDVRVQKKENFMSQAKVERYKQEKANRKKIMAQEKRKRIAAIICGWAVAIAIVGWAGYSAYRTYENNKPMETIYADLDAINDYVDTLDNE